MQIEERRVPLRDGGTATLRGPRVEDAEELIGYLKTVMGETPFLTQYPDEVRFTLEQEQDFLRGRIEDPRGAMILAFVNGEHAGNSSFMSLGGNRRSAHRCSLGIALYRRYCGMGLGRAMMEYTLELAKGCGYEQAELEVMADNARAIALYESLGFEAYGRHARVMKYDDGRYADALLMAKQL